MNKEEFDKIFTNSVSTLDILTWIIGEIKENGASKRTTVNLVKEIYKNKK